MLKKIIAIDGPAGAGKSTVARLVAKHLNYLYIDSGAMYRAITYKALKLGVPLTDEKALTELTSNTEIKLENKNGAIFVYCDGENITDKIRDPEVSNYVSLIALVPGVRKIMVRLQQIMATSGRVVMDGRDIGTVVLPNADCKIFLTASVEERAKRRLQELDLKGFNVTLEKVKEDIAQRDLLDTERKIGPLMKSPDAYLIDSTGLTVDKIVGMILSLCQGSDK